MAVRTRGFNNFSYAEIAADLGLSKTSIHHYFPTKAELGLALIDRFANGVRSALQQIEQNSDTAAQMLEGYLMIYVGSLKENKMCLCGMLAAEHETLARTMQDSINDFFDGQLVWLEKVLRTGASDGQLRYDGDPVDHARVILTTMQGGLLIAKSQRSTTALEATVANLLRTYRTSHALHA